MTLVLDSGALIALERHDRAMWRRLKALERARQVPVTHGGVVGQVWRGRGAREALLSRALSGCDVRDLDGGLGRAAGELLGKARANDVVDAALVLLAEDGDVIVSSDLDDGSGCRRYSDDSASPKRELGSRSGPAVVFIVRRNGVVLCSCTEPTRLAVDPDWNDFKISLALARAGSVAGAARALAIDQSTASRRLTALEEAVGARLVLRGGRELGWTEQGRAALSAAEAVEAAVSSATRAIRASKLEVVGAVRVSCSPGFVPGLLSLLPALREEHPGLTVELSGDYRRVDPRWRGRRRAGRHR